MDSQFNEKLSWLIWESKLSKGAFAKKLGVCPATISRLLAGQSPSAKTLCSIAEACKVSIDWLLEKGGLEHATRTKFHGKTNAER
jgi:transcriptional regulator with XRE-family HTH domain